MRQILLENLAYTRKICIETIKSCVHSPDMSIHRRIRERRLALGMASHKALADLVGVSWQTVQLWEKEGGTAPNRNRINKVAEVLDCTPEWLTTGRADIHPADEEMLRAHHDDLIRAHFEENPELERMALHYVTPREERLLEQFRLSFDEGKEKIEIAAGATKKRSLVAADWHKLQGSSS